MSFSKNLKQIAEQVNLQLNQSHMNDVLTTLRIPTSVITTYILPGGVKVCCRIKDVTGAR